MTCLREDALWTLKTYLLVYVKAQKFWVIQTTNTFTQDEAGWRPKQTTVHYYQYTILLVSVFQSVTCERGLRASAPITTTDWIQQSYAAGQSLLQVNIIVIAAHCISALTMKNWVQFHLLSRPLQSQPGWDPRTEPGPGSRPESGEHWAASHSPPGGENRDMSQSEDKTVTATGNQERERRSVSELR